MSIMLDHQFYDIAGPFSLGDLIADLAIEPLINDKMADELIHAPAELSSAQTGHISFLAKSKYKSALESSRASACFVTEKLAPLVSAQNIIPLISKSPRAHFGRIISRFVKPKLSHATFGVIAEVSASAHVHSTAILSSGVIVGDDVVIGPYTTIGVGVRIGAQTVIGANVSVECATIGEGCYIGNGAQIGGQGFGIDRDEFGVISLPHIGRTIIGNRVDIGVHSCIDRGFLGDTVIGDDVKIDNLVQIAHNCKIGAGTMIAGRSGVSGSCVIGKNVLLGGAVGLADHVTIGDGAQLAAQAGVMNDVPAGEIWSGIPAQPIRDHMRMISATRKLVGKKKNP